MGQKMTGISEFVAAIPAKTFAVAAALGLGGAAADASTRAPLLSELVLFHLAGHAVTLPIFAMLLGVVTGALALLKTVASLVWRLGESAARRIRR